MAPSGVSELIQSIFIVFGFEQDAFVRTALPVATIIYNTSNRYVLFDIQQLVLNVNSYRLHRHSN
jgi:hypothetical protein